jgi:membrane protein implicated in regulation of membrane protease activity
LLGCAPSEEDVEFMLQTIYLVALGLGGGWLAIASALSVLGGVEKDVDGGGHLDKDIDFDTDIDADIDADLDADADGHGHETSGVSWLSPLVVASTLFGFGIAGLGVHSILDLSTLSVPIALGTGVGSGWTLRTLLRMLRRVEGSSHATRRSTIGSQGEVITSIPVGGVGQVAITSGGQRLNAPARSRNGRPIPKGARVFISKVDGATFEVGPAREDGTSIAGPARAAQTTEA